MAPPGLIGPYRSLGASLKISLLQRRNSLEQRPIGFKVQQRRAIQAVEPRTRSKGPSTSTSTAIEVLIGLGRTRMHSTSPAFTWSEMSRKIVRSPGRPKVAPGTPSITPTPGPPAQQYGEDRLADQCRQYADQHLSGGDGARQVVAEHQIAGPYRDRRLDQAARIGAHQQSGRVRHHEPHPPEGQLNIPATCLLDGK